MNRIEELEKLIPEYAKAYYSGESLVSDEEFDSLVDELRELSPESEVLNKTGWGYEPDRRKIPHKYNLHVGSLSKVKKVEDIPKNLQSLCRVSAKLDGISVVSYYEKGSRILALTRGNGYEGLDVTSKINIISPETIKLPYDFTGAVRGEVLCDNETWESLEERFKDNPSANSRNFTAGVMNRIEDDEDLKYLTYVVYKVIVDINTILGIRSDFHSHHLDFTKMTEFFATSKFAYVPYDICLNSSTLNEEYLKNLFDKFNETYPCDGLVLTKTSEVPYLLNNAINYEEVAYKFESESKEVIVTDVDWTASRTGRLVPRVWFDPVELSGAMVQKCTGFNAAFIRNNKISKGTKIRVCRSGEVIPHILEVLSSNGEAELPQTCPSCGGPLVWNGEDLICENENDSQLPYRFISVAGEYHGAGYSLYSKILELFEVTDYSSLLCFLRQLLDNKTEVDSKIDTHVSGSATQNLCKAVLNQIYEGISPRTFLVACNVKGLSWEVSKQLLAAYPEYLQDLRNSCVNYDRMWSISGFGRATIDTLQSYEERIKTLLKVVKIKEELTPEAEPVKSVFTVAITGSLSIKRSEFDKLLNEKGISQSSNFKEIKYLITNNPNSTSSKMKKAKDNGVEIISEQEFFEKFLK